MKKLLRQTALQTLKTSGAFRAMRDSEWRRQRLLILCYHGISQDDEHQWRPFLYMRPEQFDRRLEILRKGKYTVLPLAEAVERLQRKDLPPRSVVLTFDDGTYDFYKLVAPRLKQYGFPATVYLTTYYSELQLPIFGLICSYMLWKVRERSTVDLKDFGISRAGLASAEDRQVIVDQLNAWADGKDYSGEQKDQLAGELAGRLGIGYSSLRARRILQLMNPQEVRSLAEAGIDFQLHSHRHRTPLDEELFRREIRDNRERMAAVVAGERKHFCYPSGAYRPEFVPWLAAEGITSATTCDTGFAQSDSNPLLLPRLIDTTGRTDLEFEGWLCGASSLISRGKRARMAYVPD